MTDRYGQYRAEITESAKNGFAITPSDATEFPQPTRGIWVGSTGDLVVDFLGYEDEAGATDVPLTAVPAGTLLPIRVVKVKAATTAGSLIGLY